MAKKVPISITLDEDVVAYIKKQAKKEERSISMVINLFLKKQSEKYK